MKLSSKSFMDLPWWWQLSIAVGVWTVVYVVVPRAFNAFMLRRANRVMEAVERDLRVKVSILVETNEVTVVKVLLERDMQPTDEIQAIVERDVSEEYPDAVCTVWIWAPERPEHFRPLRAGYWAYGPPRGYPGVPMNGAPH